MHACNFLIAIIGQSNTHFQNKHGNVKVHV